MSSNTMSLMYRFIMSAFLLYFIFPSLHAQPTSRLNRLKETLTSKIGSFKACLLGDTKCSQQEIWSARRNVGIASAVLAAIGIGMAYHKEWGPFKYRKTMRELTRLTNDTIDLTQNPNPQKQAEITKELQTVINDMKKKLSPEEQKQLDMTIQSQLQQEQTIAPSIPALPIPIEPLGPAEQIQQQLVILNSGLQIFLKDPNDTTLQEFKNIYKAYITTITTYKDTISSEQRESILALPIIGSDYSGKSLLAKVQETLKIQYILIKQALPSQIQKAVAPQGYQTVAIEGEKLHSLIDNVKKKIETYTANKTNDNLIDMQFSLFDLSKAIAPAPLSMVSEKINLAPIHATKDQFFTLVKQNKSLLEKLNKYPGYENIKTTKDVKNLLKKIKRIEEKRQ